MNRSKNNHSEKGMIRSTIRMLIPLNKHSEAIQILESVSAQTRFEPNCISYRLYRGADEVRAIMVEELWANDKDVLRHLRSDAYRRVLIVIEMAEEPPEISFDNIIRSSGVGFIENARNRSGAELNEPVI